MNDYTRAITALKHAANARHAYHPAHSADDHGDAPVREGADAFAADLVPKVEAQGGFEPLGSPSDLRAYLAWFTLDEDPSYGLPATRVITDHRIDDSEARRWLHARIDALAPTLGNDAEVFVEPCYHATARHWLDLDFRISAVTLTGQTGPALAALMASRAPPADLTHLGLQCRRAVPADADELIDLQREVFGAEPQWCWFCASERCLANWRKNYLDPPEGRHPAAEIIEQDGRVVGMFNTNWKDNPMWGPMGGLGLIFRPEIRGRGVVKTAYRRMLQRLHDDDVPLFRGTTAQPAVMGLGDVMGRRLSGWTLRRDTYFKVEHWGSLAP